MVSGGPFVDCAAVGREFPGSPPVVALASASLRLCSGEYVAVTGPSGSGKSTFLNILGCLDRPTTGSYLLGGIDVVAASERARAALRARHIGFVFQSFHLITSRTSIANVALGLQYCGVLRAERDALAADALARVGLSHRADALTRTLSGGERQRAAIARAIVKRPDVLLADEPTGNLDSASSTAVLDLFDDLRADGLGIVVVTHDSNVAARADRVVTISDGVSSDEAQAWAEGARAQT